MHKKRKIILCCILIILWAGIIFIFSNMDTNESNGKSKSTINNIIEKTVETTNKVGLTDKHPSQSKMKRVINKLNQPMRKIAHASEYFIFVIFFVILLTNIGIKGKKRFFISILLCFLYACSDEYHQTFVGGRTAQYTDTLIDTLGSVLGCLFFIIVDRIYKFIRGKKNNYNMRSE